MIDGHRQILSQQATETDGFCYRTFSGVAEKERM
jgi:hypothetical protein